MSNKRASAQPPSLKPPTSLDSALIISEQASLTGKNLISLGSNTVIHPRCKLNSLNGSIIIGNCCIISERCRIGLQSEPTQADAEGVVIENSVVVEPGAIVEARRIGEGSVIEVNSKIGKGAILGKHCKVGPSCEVADGEVVPDYTVIFGSGQRRLDQSGAEAIKLKMLSKQIDVLKKLIPSSLAHFQ
ncbi:Dynactin subunit 6 [Erysiphe necator]|uniref:Dynactin subunit 6 n=1 Tax=Uncinula necator TaxID=52586 RepID=A0A0B1P4G2_UNCNE|nr:Dynactin subunit 6 [Erysiphe necator]KHJ33168.1 putative transferase hexapeptide domain protein [Erysiphe necator]